MGLFDFFSKKSNEEGGGRTVSDRELAKLGKVAADKLAQNYDRQEAIEELGRIGDARAASALLKRFSWSMDPSITDQDEKEAAARGVVAAGDAALEPIRKYCKNAESITWPLKVLKQIVEEDRYVEELLGLLDLFDTEYVRNADPKIQLLGALEQFPSDDVRVAVEPFVEDANENVRFSAVGAVFAMNDESSVETLVAALEDEESLRVKNRIAQGLAERGWAIPEEVLDACKQALPPDFELSGGKVTRG